MGPQKHEWPRGGGTIEKNRSVRHSVKLSFGERHARVKLLEEISLPSLLKRNFSSTTGRMDPTGFEPVLRFIGGYFRGLAFLSDASNTLGR
jgi:hypothetical protein